MLVFAGELLAQAEKLIGMGLSPAEIITGFVTAKKKALEILMQPELVVFEVRDI